MTALAPTRKELSKLLSSMRSRTRPLSNGVYSLIVARGHIAYPGLDRPVRTPLLTPAFSLKNTEAIALALKAGLGLELSYLLMHALSWGRWSPRGSARSW